MDEAGGNAHRLGNGFDAHPPRRHLLKQRLELELREARVRNAADGLELVAVLAGRVLRR